MKPFRQIVALAAAALALPGWAADSVRMDVRNTFTGPMADTTVMTVLLENDGPDLRGALSVSIDGSETLYPVELPRGSRKRVLTFPANGYGELRFALQTGGRELVRKMPATNVGNDLGGSALLIGDDASGLAFLRTKLTEGRQNVLTRDLYVAPEEAPGRPLAYRALNAVVLGPGAERLGDGAVDALKDYALGGGILVFLGGASAPILEDPRWMSILPGRDWRPKTLESSAALEKIGGKPIPSAFTVLSPDSLAAGATARREGSTALETERGFGLGRVVVMGYSPLEQPLSAWEGRAKSVLRFVRSSDTQRSRTFVGTFLNAGMQGIQSYYGGPAAVVGTPSAIYATAGSTGAYVTEAINREDPFSTSLPPTSTVFGILAAYFVLVVPVSFLVLRKLKRGELAWVTAPLLSLGFAGVLFRSAENLYAASLSTASQGVVVLQQGSPDAMFYGTSQMFFPRGGAYDLKLKGVDSLAAVQNQEYYGSDALAGFNPVDVGEIVTPRLEANNLAFREMSYIQRLDDADWFQFKRIDGKRVRVENRSPYAFSGTLANGAYVSKAITLEPGAATEVPLGAGDVVPFGAQLEARDARNFTRYTGRMALSGTLTGFRPGPQIGSEVKGRNGVSMIAFAQEKKG